MIQLLDGTAATAPRLAERLGVPVHVVPMSLPETPFQFLPVLEGRWWKEVALWWPERRILVCADALGTIPFFRAGDEPAGLHPFFRLKRPRTLAGLGVEHLLVGHGEGLHGPGTGAAVDEALRTAPAPATAAARRLAARVRRG